MLNYAKALNAKPSDVVKAMFPDLLANMSPDQIAALDKLSPPLLTTTQIPSLGGSSSVSIPDGTIASQTNNPLNIKYVDGNQLGGTDSGIAAQDGGTFAAFQSPEDGLKAATQLLTSSSYAGLTVDAAMRRWSNNGYGAEVAPGINANQKMSSLSKDQLNTLVGDMAQRESGSTIQTTSTSDVVQSYVDGIKNGTVTSIAQVPAAYKSLVSVAMSNQGVESPLGDQRWVKTANGIVANYIALPGYSLTANGLPYLQRIAAAEANPGSVSDQDLLDSLTKLNTAGNAITDAQVGLITGGKSFSDVASRIQ